MSDVLEGLDEQVREGSRRVLKLCKEAGEEPTPILALALLDAASRVASTMRSGEGAEAEWADIARYRFRMYAAIVAASERAEKSS